MNTTLQEQYVSAKRALFDKAYGFLNSMQRKSVFTINGPLLILAGAGSGKTTVLVQRIAYIIKYGNAYFDTNVRGDITEAKVRQLENARYLSPDEIKPILNEFICEPCPPWAVSLAAV